MTPPDILGEALTGEHAAIYGYGVLGAHLSGADLDLGRAAETAHRTRRDTLFELFSTADSTAPAAAPGYVLPFPVTDPASAVRLATEIEERTGAIWQAALPVTAADQRELALDSLVDCALRAARWRRAAGAQPGTVPLP